GRAPPGAGVPRGAGAPAPGLRGAGRGRLGARDGAARRGAGDGGARAGGADVREPPRGVQRPAGRDQHRPRRRLSPRAPGARGHARGGHARVPPRGARRAGAALPRGRRRLGR
ncbi:hypothetical protein EG858_15840, partial [Enterococcus faecalis]